MGVTFDYIKKVVRPRIWTGDSSTNEMISLEEARRTQRWLIDKGDSASVKVENGKYFIVFTKKSM